MKRLSHDEQLFAAGQSDVLAREAQRDGRLRHEAEIHRLSRQPLPPDPLTKVRVLEPFTVAGRVPAVGEIVELPASDARNMVALRRADLV